MADKLVYAYRGASGVNIKKGCKGENVLSSPMDPQNKLSCRCFAFSTSGRFFAYCDSQKTYCVDVTTGKEKFFLELPKTVKIFFSPNDTLMVCYQPYVVYGSRFNDDGSEKVPEANVRFYSVNDGSLVAAKFAKKQSSWKPQFSEDEKFCVLQGEGSELHFYENNKFDRFVRKGVIKGLDGFELSPGLDPLLCNFIPSTGGNPGLIQLRVPYDELRKLCQKTSFNCDTCVFQWNSKGSGVLATTTVEVDKTNQSYYGVSCVYLLTKMGESFQVHLTKEGPLHALQWSPTGNTFAACFGYMPPKICIFNSRANVLWTMGEAHKNEIYFNPFGSLIAVCGFGNLAAGKIEIWDVEKRTEVTQLEVPSTTYFEWAPDGQHFITATTAPRLRVDNNFRIWHYTGELKQEHLSVDENKKPVELLQITFKPAPKEFNKFKIVELSEAERKKISNVRISSQAQEHPAFKLQNAGGISNGVYVPPHLRKTNDSSLKPGNSPQRPSAPKVDLSPEQKQAQKIKKKIDDILKLKQKVEDGIQLEVNQLKKIEKLPELEAELAQLKLGESS